LKTVGAKKREVQVAGPNPYFKRPRWEKDLRKKGKAIRNGLVENQASTGKERPGMVKKT